MMKLSAGYPNFGGIRCYVKIKVKFTNILKVEPEKT